MLDVCIITTTYRNTEKLKQCIETVTENTKFVDYKWTIWANEPNDEVKKVIHDAMYLEDILFNERIEPIFNDDNSMSFSQTNNEAVEESEESKYLLFMNDDIYPLNDSWLLNMKQIMDTDPKVGAVGGLLLYPDKQTIQHCGVMFSHRTNNLPYHMYYKQPVNKVAEFISVPRYYQAVTAACMLVRREDFEELGGFDPAYHYGFEDVDFCLNLKKKLNKMCVYTPAAQLIHHEGISGTFTDHPKIKDNVEALRTIQEGNFFNDEQFYLNDPKFMIYKPKF